MGKTDENPKEAEPRQQAQGQVEGKTPTAARESIVQPVHKKKSPPERCLGELIKAQKNALRSCAVVRGAIGNEACGAYFPDLAERSPTRPPPRTPARRPSRR
jgi:hypothetical protein